MSRGEAPERRLRVDWPECRARGLCAELLPELLVLDEWGYPVVLGPVPPEHVDLAREAVAACPRRALHLVDDQVSPVTRRPTADLARPQEPAFPSRSPALTSHLTKP